MIGSISFHMLELVIVLPDLYGLVERLHGVEELQDAVRNVEVIGERRSVFQREREPVLALLDWNSICGMRDVLITITSVDWTKSGTSCFGIPELLAALEGISLPARVTWRAIANYRRSLVSQRDRRIHLSRAPRGEVTCEESDHCQKSGSTQKR